MIALRAENKLPISDAWPMATFALTVRHLLANAAEERGFDEMTPAHVRAALLASGYLRLEYVRANLISGDEAA